MRKIIFNSFIIMAMLALLTACNVGNGVKSTEKDTNSTTTSTKAYSSSTKATQSSTSSFTNKYGTPTTKCAHPGCNNYIASSGDTNCCTKHSNRCLECNKYIDEDAMYCIDCLAAALDKIGGK